MFQKRCKMLSKMETNCLKCFPGQFSFLHFPPKSKLCGIKHPHSSPQRLPTWTIQFLTEPGRREVNVRKTNEPFCDFFWKTNQSVPLPLSATMESKRNRPPLSKETENNFSVLGDMFLLTPQGGETGSKTSQSPVTQKNQSPTHGGEGSQQVTK